MSDGHHSARPAGHDSRATSRSGRRRAAWACLALLAAMASSAAGAGDTGYLGADTAPRALLFLPPPPAPGSPEATADRAVFDATRALKDTPRWALAQADDDLGVPGLVHAMSCALGATPGDTATPALIRLISKARIDALAATGPVKDTYDRPRPYIGNDAPICNAMRGAGRGDAAHGGGPSYPSGHSTVGWTTALILSALAPGRTSALFARARSYGESRVVCGVHYVSDVEAGRVVGSAVFGALEGDPGFRADLEAARTELARLEAAAPPRDASCRVTDALSAERPY
jgi:acid phosphatase (class A)